LSNRNLAAYHLGKDSITSGEEVSPDRRFPSGVFHIVLYYDLSLARILADPVGQTDRAIRIDIRYEGTGGANHQQN
jgi:hypothetical protein